MTGFLRLAILADPDLPVPPRFYGGIERVIATLVEELRHRGHRVDLFAHRESELRTGLVPYPGESSASGSDLVRNMRLVGGRLLRGNYDLVHSFARLGYLLPVLPARLPKLMTYQRRITPRSVAAGELLGRRLEFTGCSGSLIRPFARNRRWHVVYNSVPIEKYQFRDRVDADAPLVFLGRLEEIKGPHLAIRVALETGLRLTLAGNLPQDPEHQRYFAEQVRPFVDDDQIRYVGPVDDAGKNRLLGASRALLMPILWEEPFGIVMVEALACGTPVIGFGRGAVPEVVEDGTTGWVCESLAEMVQRAGHLDSLSRKACRDLAVRKFSVERMTDAYERIYQRMIGGVASRLEPSTSG